MVFCMCGAFAGVKYESNLQELLRLQLPNCLLHNFVRIAQGEQMSALVLDPPSHVAAT